MERKKEWKNEWEEKEQDKPCGLLASVYCLSRRSNFESGE